MPAVAERPLHYRAREITLTNPESPSMSIGLFPSCIVDHFLPNAGFAAARVLQALGASVHLVEGRRCCGLPHLNSGDRDEARTMAKGAIAALEKVQADRIVEISTPKIVPDGTSELKTRRLNPGIPIPAEAENTWPIS